MHSAPFTTMAATIIAVILLTSPSASAGVVLPEVLSINLGGGVQRWNPLTYEVSMYASSGVRSIGSMARTLSGGYVVYRTQYGSPGGDPALISINPATGLGTVLVESSNAASKVVALTHTLDGDYFAYDNGLRYGRIDPDTLAFTPISLTLEKAGASLTGSGAMATSPNGDIYTWSTGRDNGSLFSKLFRIDLDTNVAIEIGGLENLNGTSGLNAMSFTPDGRLFAFTEINAQFGGEGFEHNAIYEINLSTGQPTLFTPSSGLSSGVLGGIRGAEFIPEPSTLALLTTAVLLLCPRRV